MVHESVIAGMRSHSLYGTWTGPSGICNRSRLHLPFYLFPLDVVNHNLSACGLDNTNAHSARSLILFVPGKIKSMMSPGRHGTNGSLHQATELHARAPRAFWHDSYSLYTRSLFIDPIIFSFHTDPYSSFLRIKLTVEGVRTFWRGWAW